MKNHLFNFIYCGALVLFVPLSSFGQQTFKVCDVVPADTPLEETPYREIAVYAVEAVVARIEDNQMYERYSQPIKKQPKGKKHKKNSKAPVVVQPTQVQEEPNFTLEDCADRDYPLVSSRGAHPFAAAVAYAYAQHRPLVISPDMIWLMILQGFASHVDLNAEKLRHKFVDFEGKKTLVVERPGFVKESPDNDWEGVFPEFTQQIGAYTGPALSKIAGEAFSTTGKTESAAFEIVFMDAMSSYFDFAVSFACGIPKVTLEGTAEDWAKLETDVNQLKGYELDWWIDSLQPVLHEFTLSAKGQANTAFWADIYNERRSSGGCVVDTYISGWLVKFFPYIHKRPNEYIQRPAPAPGAEAALSNIELKDLPNGMSVVDFALEDHDGKIYNMNFMAGFMGIRQNEKDFALRPEISWLVVDTGRPPTEDMVKSIKEYHERQLGAESQRN